MILTIFVGSGLGPDFVGFRIFSRSLSKLQTPASLIRPAPADLFPSVQKGRREKKRSGEHLVFRNPSIRVFLNCPQSVPISLSKLTESLDRFHSTTQSSNRLILRNFQVTSSHGNSHHYLELVESGQFAFEAVNGGDYMACFWAPDHKPQIMLTIEFDWKTGVAAKDWSNVANKGSVDIKLL